MTGLGGERLGVPNVHNDLTSGWAEVLLSCIKTMKPFRVSLVHDTNGSQWITWLTQSLGAIAITWPIEKGYSTGGVASFLGGVTDYTFGSPDIQGRINAELTLTPSGMPTITAGTSP